MFNNRNKYYSFINNIERNIWSHSDRNYQTYYDVKYDHIIDVIVNNEPAQEKLFLSVQLMSDTFNYINNSQTFVNVENVTFDRFEMYNSNQVSGLRNLVVKTNAYDDVTLIDTSTLMDRVENYWRFNRFRDMAANRNNEPLYTQNWTLLSNSYNQFGQGYIDSIINPNALNLNKPYYEQGKFRSKYVGLRLYFKPDNDYKIITDLITVLNKPSIR
jgi:hypothetical protein